MTLEEINSHFASFFHPLSVRAYKYLREDVFEERIGTFYVDAADGIARRVPVDMSISPDKDTVDRCAVAINTWLSTRLGLK